jgi:hypothetical protein
MVPDQCAHVLAFEQDHRDSPPLSEKRHHERIPLTVEVELVDPAIGKFIANTRDISDGGVFVRLGPRPWPELGATVTVRVNQMLGDEPPPLLRARVVRVTAEGVALAFVLDAGP